MKFGKVLETKVESEENIRDGKSINKKLRYEERVRVRSYDEAEVIIADFANKIRQDEGLIDPAWRYEKRALLKIKGHFDVIICYTRIEEYQ